LEEITLESGVEVQPTEELDVLLERAKRKAAKRKARKEKKKMLALETRKDKDSNKEAVNLELKNSFADSEDRNIVHFEENESKEVGTEAIPDLDNKSLQNSIQELKIENQALPLNLSHMQALALDWQNYAELLESRLIAENWWRPIPTKKVECRYED
jgi:hypothetical protein